MKKLEVFLYDKKNIQQYAEELTIYNGKIEEVLYDPLTCSQELKQIIKSYLIETFAEVIDEDLWESFSFQYADGLTYIEHKVTIDYRGADSKAEELNLNLVNPHQVYSTNFFISSKKKDYKFFDKNYDQYLLPDLPENSSIKLPYGMGVMPKSERMDLYFTNNNLNLVEEFFQAKGLSHHEYTLKIDQDNKKTKLFGIAFNKKSLDIIKIKRYIYPQDPELKLVLHDEPI